jgi:GNAT superfamily N-acetyltransferase
MEHFIRQARLGDAAGIARVHVTTWQAAYRGIVPDDYLDALTVEQRIAAYERSGLLNDAERPMFVFDRKGVILGFVGVGPSTDETGVGELYSIYVDSEHWGGGVGAALLGHADAWLEERFPEATLWVLEDNVRTRRFYERSGWRPDGTVKNDDRGSFVLREVRYRTSFGSA